MTSPSKKKPAAKAKLFKRSKKPSQIPLGATSWEDAYKKTLKNLERAYDRLLKLHDVNVKLEQAETDLIALATIINYLELRLELKHKGEE